MSESKNSAQSAQHDVMDKLVALCKRRGFVFAGSDIYGGLANSYDYGPLGVQLKKNIIDAWWKTFVQHRTDMVGLDSSIILHPKVWEASGHVSGFNDALIDCKHCKLRTRADHLIENFFESKNDSIQVEGLTETQLDELILEHRISCPSCKKFDWTPVRKFNLLFETSIGIVEASQSKAYLRGETAQGIFINFKNILDSSRVSLPFGVGQVGKSFRNEITKGNFIFRTLEFEQAEIEYFFNPKKVNWETLFETWKTAMWEFITQQLGVPAADLRWRAHGDEERSFYSKRTEDLEYKFPFGFKELWGLAYRTDYDLTQHMKFSGADLRVLDIETNEKFVPHVIEPAVGVNRLLAMTLLAAYTEEDHNGSVRTYLNLPAALAPYRAAVFPLVKNKAELVEKAQAVYEQVLAYAPAAWDERGNIGKRYLSQDEIGTPYCVVIDYQTLEDNTVTVRNRNTAQQERISIENLEQYLMKEII